MRLFTAIELPPDLRAAVAGYAAAARAAVPDGAIRWVAPENLHLTLIFLGSVAEEDLPERVRAVERGVAAAAPLRLELEGSGRFTTAAWVGVVGDLEPLGALVERLQGALGHRDDRPFHPHVTIGRFRDGRRARHVRLPPVGPLGGFEAREVVLFRSETLPEGPRYTALHRAALGG